MQETKELQPRTRSEVLDVAKGIGILLVVWAHAKAPFSRYIYQFHMPFFFLISGYLFNKKDTLKNFVWKRVKSLYIPFIAWNILGSAFFWGMGIEKYTVSSFAGYVCKVVLTLSKNGKFFGATWFLGALFVISILYKILDTYIEESNSKRMLITMIFIAIGTVGFTINFKYMLSRTMVLGMFYALGVVAREQKEVLATMDKPAVAVFCALFFALIARKNSANMGANQYRYIAAFVIGALCASYVFIYVSHLITKLCSPLKEVFVLFGKYSIDIVIWQFVAFRIVIALQLYLNGISFGKLLKYYPMYDSTHGWWAVYTIVGMFASLLIGWILKQGIWGKLLKKLSIVS